MYRILVVDNEPYVADWIASLLENGSGEELDVCRAYTAREALVWLTKTRIDVLVSDICMPGMDGIELAREVTEYWPEAKIILITAHADFDFAVSAIKSNVVGYILKNQGDDVILQEVERALRLVDEDVKRRRAACLEQDMGKVLPLLRNRLFHDILSKDDFDGRMIQQLNSLGILLEEDAPFYLMLSNTRECVMQDNLLRRYAALQETIHLVEGSLGDCYTLYSVDMGGGRLAWILYGSRKRRLPLQEAALIQGRIELLQDSVENGLSFILYPQEIYLKDLRRVYLQLENTMGYMPSESFFRVERVEPPRETLDVEGILERVRVLIEEGRLEAFSDLLLKYEEMTRIHTLGQKEAYNLYYALAIQLNAYLEKKELQGLAYREKVILPDSEQFAALRERLFYPPVNGKWEEKFLDLRRLGVGALMAEERIKSKISRNTVEELKKFIQEHISEDISLTRLSEATGYNTSYLSRIFRMQTGETLTEYIGKQKLEKIQELMKDKRLNISDIAEKTGFESRTYFNRFMKKWTGMSPKTYRQNRLGIDH